VLRAFEIQKAAARQHDSQNCGGDNDLLFHGRFLFVTIFQQPPVAIVVDA
jgi:hypothetical protein